MGEFTEPVKLLHEHRPPVCLLIALCLLRWGGHAIGRTFPGRGELLERLKIHSPLEKDRKHWMWEEKQIEMRTRYGIEMPSWKTRNRILEDFPRVTGRQLNFYNNEAELMSFW
jgi:hypothetical protein